MPNSLEHYLIDAAKHVLAGVFTGADPVWIQSCANLQVLGADRAGLSADTEASCVAMLGAFETQLAGRRIPFAPNAQRVIVGDVTLTESLTINVG